jgi:hypothetical protein
LRTAIVSDLHLGGAFGEDLLRDGEIRRLLFAEIAAADRVVLLGDALELRELPLRSALEGARPFFEELGAALPGREVVLVPGNHDHRLADPLVEEVTLGAKTALGLEHRAAPAGRAATQIAAWLGNARLEIAYPGIWLREDVYATHGHYMDCHMTLPRVECLAAAVVMRLFGGVPDPAAPADYEQVLQAVYGLTDGLVQAGVGRSNAIRHTRPSELAWRAIAEPDRNRSRVRRAAIRAGVASVPATVWTLNRLLRSEFDADLSPAAITQSGLAAAVEMARRLDLGEAHVITGHTHRGGPYEGEAEWALPGGGRLHNTGSWVFASAFHYPGTPPGPYWPGTVTWLGDEGPPRPVRLLVERPREELQETVRRLRQSATRR